MHITNKDLKVLIDVLAERLDDDLDMLSDTHFMEERESVQMAWAVKDLLEHLRQEQRSRTGQGTHQFAGISNAPSEPMVTNAMLARLDQLEGLVSEHEAERMALRAELGVVQAGMGDLLAQSNDHAERLDLLKARDPDVLLWGRIRAFERKMERWAADVSKVLEARTGNAELQAEALLRLTKAVEDIYGDVQALEVQSDDRWVRTQQRWGKVNELQSRLEEHVGETGTRH